MPFISTKKTGPKYRSKKVTLDGIIFDSKSEARYYMELRTMERAGQVKILEIQPKVYLSKAKILYKPDFLIELDGVKIYVDVKGPFKNPRFALKARLWKAYGPATLWVVASTNFGEKKEIHPDEKGAYSESD